MELSSGMVITIFLILLGMGLLTIAVAVLSWVSKVGSDNLPGGDRDSGTQDRHSEDGD